MTLHALERPQSDNALAPDQQFSSIRDLRQPAVVAFWLTAVGTSLFFLYNILGPVDALTARFSVDDSFYYFQTAWQTAQHGFVTFDGMHQANGVHFLWFALVYALALLSPDKIFLLKAAYLMALGIVVLTYFLIWRIGTHLDDRRRHLTALFSMGFSFVLAAQNHQLFVGMESTVHMATLWFAFLAFLKLFKAIETDRGIPTRAFLVFSAGLVLVAWARLDSGVISALLFGFALVAVCRACSSTSSITLFRLWPALLVVGLGAAIQFGFFFASAGTLIPISGLIKSASPHETLGEMLLTFGASLFPFGKSAFSVSLGFIVFGAAVFCFLFGSTVRSASRSDGILKRAHQFAVVLGIGVVLIAAVLCVHHNFLTRWYFAPVYFFFVLSVGLALHGAAQRRDTARLGGEALYFVLPAAVIFLQLCFGYPTKPIYEARYRLGVELATLTEEGSTLASFNAGQLAYFSSRNLINLDGLVNDNEFRKDILGREENFLRYLRDNNIKYVIDYDFYWASRSIIENTTSIFSYPVQEISKRILDVREVTD